MAANSVHLYSFTCIYSYSNTLFLWGHFSAAGRVLLIAWGGNLALDWKYLLLLVRGRRSDLTKAWREKEIVDKCHLKLFGNYND